jgi:uroporphyrinogen-III synthase
VGEGGARALAARARPDAAVVVATSDLGGAEARAARPDAVLWPLYRTALAETLPAAAREALRGTFDVWFGSPSAVEGFARLAPGALARARRVYTFGATTRDEVVARGRADATPVSDAGSAPRPLTDR